MTVVYVMVAMQIRTVLVNVLVILMKIIVVYVMMIHQTTVCKTVKVTGVVI